MRKFVRSTAIAIFFFVFFSSQVQAKTLSCGQVSPDTLDSCTCVGGTFSFVPNTSEKCCGWLNHGSPNGCSATANTGGVGVSSGTFDTLNNAIFNGAPNADLTTPRGIISRLIPYLFTFGGIILFIMLIWGGFEMLTGAADPKAQSAGKERITAAIIGFILLFASYWIAQLVQAIFGISIL